MELIYKKDAIRAVLHNTGDAAVAAVQAIEPINPFLDIEQIENYKILGYKVRDLILFAETCKRNDVQEADLKQAAWNIELAVRAVMNERQEIVKNTVDEFTIRITPDFEKAYAEMMGKEQTDEQIH